MNFLLPFGALLYGIYSLYIGQTNPDVDTNLKYWVQTLGATGGGAGVLVANYWDLIKAGFSKLFGGAANTEPAKVEPKSEALLPTALEDRDYECIVHLRNRFTKAGSAEGLELTKKVNDLIFTITIDQNKDKKDA